ncbi:MAG: hypothetical protein KatS3mg094_550 [Candidatus Parcubacteria bacterium]|nr:MAG: hypothetical protein KatS3mg094_550 [Candidatus Parcubacteria bacterium]
MKTGIATFSLDTGKCPKWLFERMEKLAGIISEIIIEEFGEEEFVRRLSDPYWFQAFGCALAFDWNSSGLTVTTTAALKSALKEKKLGVYICGGKGKTSRKTPEELVDLGEKLGIDPIKYLNYSKLIAKIDNSLIQDGFNIYHHIFILTKSGNFAVIQQGMNTCYSLARRYHWWSGAIKEDITLEPHTGIVSQKIIKNVLNLTAKESLENKKLIIDLINSPQELIKDLKYLERPQKSLFLPNIEFKYHPVLNERFDIKRLKKTIEKASFLKPEKIEEILLIEGVGPKTIRALSLVSELIYGAKPSFDDPARYSFVSGGKDGTPYPVDRIEYNRLIEILNKAIKISKQQKILFNK